eukprot:TRINITY_DN3104_c0_g1_i2.p1 TRINITY_DN3104_c0_g1~~TRINITY_DN3104_c0_g1_i2.p1  ORF type:complete len:481 (-),score=116.21 TRINITY_DN3104_c0_g1_i2:65-1507(-)
MRIPKKSQGFCYFAVIGITFVILCIVLNENLGVFNSLALEKKACTNSKVVSTKKSNEINSSKIEGQSESIVKPNTKVNPQNESTETSRSKIFDEYWPLRKGQYYGDLFVPTGCPDPGEPGEDKFIIYYDIIPDDYHDESCPDDINPVVKAEHMLLCPKYRLFENCKTETTFPAPENLADLLDPSKNPDKPPIPAFGFPTIFNPFFLERALYTLDYPIQKLVIYWTENVNDMESAIYRIKKRLGDLVMVIHSAENRGVSHAWNTIYQQVEPSLRNYVLIIGDDIKHYPGSLAGIAKYMENKRKPDGTFDAFVFDAKMDPAGIPFFSAFGITVAAYLKVGTFDENIYIAYCEDLDYMWRVRATETERIDDIPQWHVWHGKETDGRYVSGQSVSSIPSRLQTLHRNNAKVHTQRGFCPYVVEKFGPVRDTSFPRFSRSKAWNELPPNQWRVDHKFKHRVIAGCDSCKASQKYPYPQNRVEWER